VAFTLPAAYTRHSESVHRAYATLVNSARKRWDALALSRKQKVSWQCWEL
jgi:hypothetical protein